jgi:ribose transport system ATP-binding protein
VEGEAGAPGLVLEGITRSFGATRALRGVSLEARAGRVHALLGENGAGKSTLLGVLSGAVAADGGRMLLGGRALSPRGPLDARRAGIVMVHQELSLCPHLSVEDNVVLGDEPGRRGIIDAGARRKRVLAALAQISGEGPGEGAAEGRIPGRDEGASVGERIQPLARVSSLSPADAQKVELARALATPGCRVLLLDEPTSSLGSADARALLALVRRLAAGGMVIVYVSHFLEEIRTVADDFTVLRDGEVADRGEIAGRTGGELVAAMTGRTVAELYPRSPRTPGDVVLEATALGGERRPERASLALRRGEVLGVAGLLGAGRTELLRCIFGLDRVVRGEIRVGAYSGRPSPRASLGMGVGMLSEDRKGEGLAGAMSVADNVVLSRASGLGPWGLIVPSRKQLAAQRWMDRLGVKASGPGQPVGELSGGNQQKVALCRLLHHDVDVLLLDEPTRGIDVGSKEQIYRLIDELALAGKAILLVSSQVAELLGVCDRVAVMRRGVLGEAGPASSWTEASLLLEASGA